MTNRNREYQVIVRGLIQQADVDSVRLLLERTEDRIWLSRTRSYDRHTLRGVPARRIDILVDERADNPPADHQWMAELGEKSGKFDGAVRPRLALRLMDHADLAGLHAAEPQQMSLTVLEDGLSTHLALGDHELSFRRLRWQPSTEDDSGARIVTWHWSRYYGHLPWADAEALAESFQIVDGETLAEANRRASRELYRLSRDLGWHKLTSRERQKLEITGDAQWVRDAVVSEARARRDRRIADAAPNRWDQGVGEYTLVAAGGAATLVARHLRAEGEE